MGQGHRASFGDILRKKRLEKGWTQAEVAEKIGSDHGTVSRWEHGKQRPTPQLQKKLCELFELTQEAFGLKRNEQEVGLPELYVYTVSQDSQFLERLEKTLPPHFKIWPSQEERQQESPHEMLRQALRNVQALVLLASPHTSDNPNVRRALALAEQDGCPVLVLWIAGRRRKEVLPAEQTAVRAYDVIDARGQRFATAIDELLSALEDLPPRWSAAPTQEPRNPYKGLQAFQTEHARDFFGRERLTEKLIDEIDKIVIQDKPNEQASRLLAVIGASGSGKSSVVLAGVLPLLQSGELPSSREWIYLPRMQPSSDPLHALADALASHLPQRNQATLLDDLQSAYGLHLLARQLVVQPDTKIVLVIDQFEELFAQTIDEQKREQFINSLVYACTQPGGSLLVFLTMRADFYDRLMSYTQLSELVEHHNTVTYTTYTMNSQELRATIEKPAALLDVQMSFEGDLCEQLLADVQEQEGALPLLQFTLDKLFKRRNDHQLMLQAYEELGRVKGALSSQAESTYLALKSDKHRDMAGRLFLHLIERRASMQEITRRREILDTFSFKDPGQTNIMRETLDAFVQERLLTINRQEATQPTTVEIGHEALIRAWPRLRDWIDHAPDITQQQRIIEDAHEWQLQNRPKKRLYSNPQLKRVTKLWPPTIEVAEFIRASQQAQAQRRRFSIVSVLILVILAFGTIGVVRILPPTNSFTVTTLQDGNGVPGSLRDALNRIPPGGRISFAANVKGTLLLKTNLLITKNVTIVGPGEQVLAVSGGTGGYDLQIIDKATVTISDLAFTHTRSELSSLIYNEGTLTLNAIRVSNNSVTGYQYNDSFSGKSIKIAGLGGGITNAGMLTLTNSQVMDNTADNGGGIENLGTLVLIHSQVISNIATGRPDGNGLGGGIYNPKGMVTLTNSLVSGNTAANGGGGIANAFGTLLLNNSTISNNTSLGGGGIVNIGTLTLTHSTISENAATGNNSGGGGILNLSGKATLIDSLVSANTTPSFGGGIDNGFSTLLLNNSTVSNNRSLDGGGIANIGILTLTHSTVSENVATGNNGGGIDNIKGKCQVNDSWISHNKTTNNTDASGGGISNETSLDLTNSTVSDNAATGTQAAGGGIVNDGTLILTNSTVSNNIANGTQLAGGGGIITGSILKAVNSTISGNIAVSSQGTGVGGGIDTHEGILTLTNSTISTNIASGMRGESHGGGLLIKGSQIVITFCTIYGNKATLNDGDTTNTYGGGINVKNVGEVASHVVIKSTLVAGNVGGSGPDITGSIISGGYNLIQNSSGISFIAPLNLHSTDHTGYTLSSLDIDPILKNHGGPTQTLTLITGSPAIGSIPASACDIATDQRGVARPQNGTCDIGAYQSTPTR